jgi:hypothetical protein
MIGAIEQKLLKQLRVARNRPRPETRRIRALRQAVEDDQVRKPVPPELLRGLERSQRWARIVDLRIALVRRNHEAVAIRMREQRAPFVQRQDTPRRVRR